MSVIKLWGRASSANVQKVLWCAEEAGIAVARIDVGGPFGGNRDPAYLAMNPNGLVPTLQDGDLTIWESNTILRYLAATYAPGSLYPIDPGERAKAECWMDWQISTPYADMTALYKALIRTAPADRDPVAMEAMRRRLCDAWGLVDAHLSRNAYLAGDQFTMADFPLGTLSYRWFTLKIERPDLPNLRRWHDGLRQRRGYAAHVMQPLA